MITRFRSWLSKKGLTVNRLLLLIATVVCLYICINRTSKESTSNIKYILEWVPTNKLPIEPFTVWKIGQEEFELNKCPFTNCFLTQVRYKFQFDLTKFDAIIFNGQSLKRVQEPDLPSVRWFHQKYIFLNTESSDGQPICNPIFDGYFNWTATYKLNSDIRFSYILIKNMSGDEVGPRVDMTWVDDMSDFYELKSLQTFSRRTKAAAWFVSHCRTRSKREVYAEKLKCELNKLNLTLDMYGRCGKLKCPKRKRSCDDHFKNNYYFYLAFENSFADDYITEKVTTALRNDVVPIVYGGANYSRYLPPGSYLDARKHEPKELAGVMAQLIRTPAAYNGFFRWKNHYSYHRPLNVCGLCAALNNQTMLKTSIIEDFRRWWNPDFVERCKTGLKWGT